MGDDIEQEIARMAKQPKGNGIQRSKPDHEFINLAEQLGRALIETCKRNVELAEHQLKDAEERVAQMFKEMQVKSEEIAATTEKLTRYGERALEAHKEFYEDGQPRKEQARREGSVSP